MDKLHHPPPKQLIGQDGESELSAPQIVAVRAADGSPVSPELQARINSFVSDSNNGAARVMLAQYQQREVGVLWAIMQELGDKWELEDLDRVAPQLKELAGRLKLTPAYKHLNANGTLQPTKDAVHASATTREGRVQFAWSSLLVGLNTATGGLADLFATVLLWVPMLLLANATEDDAEAQQ